jgi:hypothetical protein
MEELELPSDAVLQVLANPALFQFKPGIWYAVNPPEELVETAPPRSLGDWASRSLSCSNASPLLG